MQAAREREREREWLTHSYCPIMMMYGAVPNGVISPPPSPRCVPTLAQHGHRTIQNLRISSTVIYPTRARVITTHCHHRSVPYPLLPLCVSILLHRCLSHHHLSSFLLFFSSPSFPSVFSIHLIPGKHCLRTVHLLPLKRLYGSHRPPRPRPPSLLGFFMVS